MLNAAPRKFQSIQLGFEQKGLELEAVGDHSGKKDFESRRLLDFFDIL